MQASNGQTKAMLCHFPLYKFSRVKNSSSPTSSCFTFLFSETLQQPYRSKSTPASASRDREREGSLGAKELDTQPRGVGREIRRGSGDRHVPSTPGPRAPRAGPSHRLPLWRGPTWLAAARGTAGVPAPPSAAALPARPAAPPRPRAGPAPAPVPPLLHPSRLLRPAAARSTCPSRRRRRRRAPARPLARGAATPARAVRPRARPRRAPHRPHRQLYLIGVGGQEDIELGFCRSVHLGPEWRGRTPRAPPARL